MAKAVVVGGSSAGHAAPSLEGINARSDRSDVSDVNFLKQNLIEFRVHHKIDAQGYGPRANLAQYTATSR
jgi:hypothetical protein